MLQPPARPPAGLPTAAEFDAERRAQAFAAVHLTNAIAGLTLCQAQVATLYGAEALTEWIAQLRDMESCLEDWGLKTDEAERALRSSCNAAA
jgi:hypothetical protein